MIGQPPKNDKKQLIVFPIISMSQMFARIAKPVHFLFIKLCISVDCYTIVYNETFMPAVDATASTNGFLMTHPKLFAEFPFAVLNFITTKSPHVTKGSVNSLLVPDKSKKQQCISPLSGDLSLTLLFRNVRDINFHFVQ